MFAKHTKKPGAQSQGNSPHKKSKIFGAFLNSSYQALQQHNQLQQNLQSIIGEKMKEIVKMKKDKKSEELRQKLATQINVFLKNIDTHQLMDLDDEAVDHLKNFTQINRESILTPLHNISGIEEDECSTPKFKREEEVPSEFEDFDHHKPGDFDLDSARQNSTSEEKPGPRYGRISSNSALGSSSLSAGLHTGPHSSRHTEDRLMQTQHVYYARGHSNMFDNMNRTMRSGGDGTGGGVSCYSNPSSNQSFLKNELQTVIQKNLNQKSFLKDLLKLTKKHNLSVKKKEATPGKPPTPMAPKPKVTPASEQSTPQQPEAPTNLISLFSTKLKEKAGIEDSEEQTPGGPCTRCDEFQTSYNGMMVLLLETLNDIIHVAPSIFSQNSFHENNDQSEIMNLEEHKQSTGGYDETPHIIEVEEQDDKPMVVLYDVDTQTDFIATKAAAVQVNFTQKLNQLQNELKVLQMEMQPIAKPKLLNLSAAHSSAIEVAPLVKKASKPAALVAFQAPALTILPTRKAMRSLGSQITESPKLQQQVQFIQQDPSLATAAVSHIVEKAGPAKKQGTPPSAGASMSSISSMGSIAAQAAALQVGVTPQTIEKKQIVSPSPKKTRAKYEITKCAYSFQVEATKPSRPRADSDTQTERDVNKITPVKNKLLQTDRMMLMSRDSQTDPEPVVEPVVIPTQESEVQTNQSGVVEIAEGHAQTEIKQFISIKSQTFHPQFRGQITQTEGAVQVESAAAEVQTMPQLVVTSSAEIQTSVTGEIKQVVPTMDSHAQAEAIIELQEIAWKEVQCQTIRAGLLHSRNQDAQTNVVTTECSEIQTEGSVHEARDCQTETDGTQQDSVECQTDKAAPTKTEEFGAQVTPYVDTFGVQVDRQDPTPETHSQQTQAGVPVPETDSKELQVELRPATVESETQAEVQLEEASSQAELRPIGQEVQTQVSFRPTVKEFQGQADIRLASSEAGGQVDLKLASSEAGMQTNLKAAAQEFGLQTDLRIAVSEFGQQAEPLQAESGSQADFKPTMSSFEQQFEFKPPALEAESQASFKAESQDTGSQAVVMSTSQHMQVVPSVMSVDVQVDSKPKMVDAHIMAAPLLPTGMATAVQTEAPSQEIEAVRVEEVKPELSERYCQTEGADHHFAATQTVDQKQHVSESVQTELNHDFLPPDIGRLTQRVSSSRIATMNENSSFDTALACKVDDILDNGPTTHGEPTPEVNSQRKFMNFSYILNSNRSNRSQRSHRPRSPAQQAPMKTLNDYDDSGLDEGDIYDELPGHLSDNHESEEMLADPVEEEKLVIVDDLASEDEGPERYFKQEFSQVDEEEELAEQFQETIDLQEALNAQHNSVFHTMPHRQTVPTEPNLKVEVFDEPDLLNNSVNHQIQDGEQLYDQENFLGANQSMMIDQEDDSSLRLLSSPNHQRKKSKMQKKLEQYMDEKLSRNRESPDNTKVPDINKGRRTTVGKAPQTPLKVDTRFSNTMTSGMPLKSSAHGDRISKAIQSAMPKNPRKSISGLSQFSVSSSKRELTTKVIMDPSPTKKVQKTFGRVRKSEATLKPSGLLQARTPVVMKSPSKAEIQSKKKFGPKLVNSLEKKKVKDETKLPSKEPFQLNISEMDDVESLPGVAPMSVASSSMGVMKKASSGDYSKVVKKKMSKQVKGIVSRLTMDTVNSKLRKMSDPPL